MNKLILKQASVLNAKLEKRNNLLLIKLADLEIDNAKLKEEILGLQSDLIGQEHRLGSQLEQAQKERDQLKKRILDLKEINDKLVKEKSKMKKNKFEGSKFSDFMEDEKRELNKKLK